LADLGLEVTRETLFWLCLLLHHTIFHTQQTIRVDMILTCCLLLMTALAVNTLVAGQPIPVQGDKPSDDSQQEITTGMVPEEPIQAVGREKTVFLFLHLLVVQ
jgi:hypothetical protein